jgi:hypothetical protein
MFDSLTSRRDATARSAPRRCDHLPGLAQPAEFEVLEQRRLLSGGPAITISDVSHEEGQSGTTAYTFTVSLSRASSKQVSVRFATADGSAVAGVAYVRSSGTLNFARGQTRKSVTVLVKGDATYEPDESFFVNLSRASNAFIADAQGEGKILNDDPAPPPVQDWPLPPQPEGDCNDGPYGCQ